MASPSLNSETISNLTAMLQRLDIFEERQKMKTLFNQHEYIYPWRYSYSWGDRDSPRDRVMLMIAFLLPKKHISQTWVIIAFLEAVVFFYQYEDETEIQNIVTRLRELIIQVKAQSQNWTS